MSEPLAARHFGAALDNLRKLTGLAREIDCALTEFSQSFGAYTPDMKRPGPSDGSVTEGPALDQLRSLEEDLALSLDRSVMIAKWLLSTL